MIFPCFEKHDDSRTSAVCNHLVKKQHFESKFSNCDPSGKQASNQEVAYEKERSYCNEYSSYFESDSSLLKREVFSLGDSSSSDGHTDDM